MMKAAVCDDLEADRKQISKYISHYAEKRMLDIKPVLFENGEDLLAAFAETPFPIVFLDIYMGGLSGVETAFRIREKNQDCFIIFTTTSPDFRAQGFEVGATHYLLKPMAYSSVEVALDRCKRALSEAAEYITVLAERQNVRILLKDIVYAEVFGKAVVIHTVSGKIKTYCTLGKLQSLLAGGPFLKCHRCFIVNMRFIAKVLAADFELVNGVRIPIHRRDKKEIKDEYSRYFINAVRMCEDD